MCLGVDFFGLSYLRFAQLLESVSSRSVSVSSQIQEVSSHYFCKHFFTIMLFLLSFQDSRNLNIRYFCCVPWLWVPFVVSLRLCYFLFQSLFSVLFRFSDFCYSVSRFTLSSVLSILLLKVSVNFSFHILYFLVLNFFIWFFLPSISLQNLSIFYLFQLYS